jgi:ABC-2 type transport system ATP-binding protein
VLALGVGFELDMTASENAYINASLLGLTRDEVRDRLTQILAFADLGDFADVPVRHYSSGMMARLGFGVAMHVDADILLIDEVLAVGDGAFQAKCLARIRELQRAGTTLLLATHDLVVAREICNRGMWIDAGRLRADGPMTDVTAAYESALAVRT